MRDVHGATLKRRFCDVKPRFMVAYTSGCHHQAMLDHDSMRARLRAAIAASGVKQTAIAHEFGITEQAVSGWLRTGKISPNRLPRLARLLGCEPSYFIPELAPDDVGVREPAMPYLSADERVLLEKYRLADAAGKRTLQTVGTAVAEPTEQPRRKRRG